jgi:hypothetical protein
VTSFPPPHMRRTLQTFAGPVEGSRVAAESVESMHSCMDLSLRPWPARFSGLRTHAGGKEAT